MTLLMALASMTCCQGSVQVLGFSLSLFHDSLNTALFLAACDYMSSGALGAYSHATRSL